MRNVRLLATVAMVIGLFLTVATAMASVETTPIHRQEISQSLNGASIVNGELVFTKQAAPGDTVWLRVHDDDRCDEELPEDGGQGTGDAPGFATWCWELGEIAPGVYDSCSSQNTEYGGLPLPGCFTHYDIFSQLTNQWHLDTFLAYPLAGGEDSTPWCGEFGDTLIWENDWGYGPDYNWSLILALGTSAVFSVADGWTIGGVHMYDSEVNYDYCYLEYTLSNTPLTSMWTEIDRYFGTCNADVGCPDASGGPAANYGCAQYEAFLVEGPTGLDNSTDALHVRWRFASDKAWDDEDASGGVHTDGAWRIDHIYVKGDQDQGHYYPDNDPFRTAYEDFENGLPVEWSAPFLPQATLGGYWSGGSWVYGIPVDCDWWHLEDDPGYKNYGNTCSYSNNWMWVADDESQAQNQEDTYHYRLVSPVLECGQNNPYWDPNEDGPGPDNIWTGVVVETDEYLCILDIVGDVTDTQVRTYDNTINRWTMFDGDDYVMVGGCEFWNVDQNEDWSQFLGAQFDSIQFSWEFLDRCDYNSSGLLPCMGQHRKATYIIDNISIGVYQAETTQWYMTGSYRFTDTFARDVEMHSLYKENWELFPSDTWEDEDSLQIQIRDFNGIVRGPPPLNSTAQICWRISTDCGQTWDKESGRAQGATEYPAEVWNNKIMNFSDPDDADAVGPTQQNGAYRTIIGFVDNNTYLGGLAAWPEGTVIEYFFVAEDSLGNLDTLPNRNALGRNDERLVETASGREFDRRFPWPYEVNVLPCPTSKDALPVGQNHSVLLVDGYGRWRFDISEDQDGSNTAITVAPQIDQIYKESLDRLGVQYDFYRSGYGVSRGGATPVYSQPSDQNNYGGIIDHRGGPGNLIRRYDTVIWLFGDFNSLTVHDSTQLELATYLDIGGTEFATGANTWVIGNDLCEDEGLTDPVWTNDQADQTTNAAYFWQTLCGLTMVSGGCADDGGHASYSDWLIGQGGSCLSGLTKVGGYWDCPLRGQPDVDATVAAATSIMKYEDYPGATQFAYSRMAHGNGSNVVVTLAGLAMLCGPQERDCVAQAILGSGCFNVGIPVPKADCTINVSVPGEVPSTDRLVLNQNKPNPFNPTTSISFTLPTKSQVSLKVYDIAGREVRTLVDNVLEAGNNQVTWLGRDNQGNDVSSGVYFYRMTAGKETATKKMVLLR